VSEDTERSTRDLLQDVVGNVQGILRSQILLAQAEVQAAAAGVLRPAAWLAIGLVLAVHAVGILLWALVHALATMVALWMAAGLVGLVVGLAAALLIRQGARGVTRVHAKPERTIASVRENVRWVND
jgi:uncharacterized membrane protein YqjE